NIDGVASLYRNRSQGRHFLRVKLLGPPENPLGIGAKVQLTAQGQPQSQQLTLTRGFQSAVEPILHFGLGTAELIERVTVIWPDGKQQRLSQLQADQVLELDYLAAEPPHSAPPPTVARRFTPVHPTFDEPFQHQENGYDDYLLEPLLPYRPSTLGPGLSVGDINGDGLEDFFVGNAYDASSRMYVQTSTGDFTRWPGPWELTLQSETLGSSLFDADGDGDLDLYVVNGGNEFFRRPDMVQDQLYINLGQGEYVAAPEALPAINASGSQVRPADFDGDGDLDLFVAGRLVPGQYPLPARSYLLRNEGGRDAELRFRDVTQAMAPELLEAGLVTDARWLDYNGDQQLDLIIAGEWMPLRTFTYTGQRFEEETQTSGLAKAVGWWQSLAAGDFDGDGDLDLIAGNLGTNFKYQAHPEEPFSVYSGDFDQNKRLDIVLSYEKKGIQLPLRGRECSSQQIPAIELKFKDYHSFATATLPEIYGDQNLAEALQYHATHFASSWVENRGGGKWSLAPG
ncbi:MAG: FG-GAP-like repeat-containing protein, partial [Bacteroidota bacterium]